MEDIHSKLQEIRNPIQAIGMLIREMDYETEIEMERGDYCMMNISFCLIRWMQLGNIALLLVFTLTLSFLFFF